MSEMGETESSRALFVRTACHPATVTDRSQGSATVDPTVRNLASSGMRGCILLLDGPSVRPPSRNKTGAKRSAAIRRTNFLEDLMHRRQLLHSAAAFGATVALPRVPIAQTQQRAICYNCPPEWADWGGMLRLINQKLAIAVPPDNKNSGQSLAALIAEKANPVADVVYLGGQVGPQAREAGVI